MRRLAAAIDTALEPLGFPPENRPFRGHVTLARVRSPRGLDRLARALEAAAETRMGEWTADDVVLYRSRLRPTGAIYEPLAHFGLKNVVGSAGDCAPGRVE
jgi:2'-5' RNA ligase